MKRIIGAILGLVCMAMGTPATAQLAVVDVNQSWEQTFQRILDGIYHGKDIAQSLQQYQQTLYDYERAIANGLGLENVSELRLKIHEYRILLERYGMGDLEGGIYGLDPYSAGYGADMDDYLSARIDAPANPDFDAVGKALVDAGASSAILQDQMVRRDAFTRIRADLDKEVEAAALRRERRSEALDYIAELEGRSEGLNENSVGQSAHLTAEIGLMGLTQNERMIEALEVMALQRIEADIAEIEMRSSALMEQRDRAEARAFIRGL